MIAVTGPQVDPRCHGNTLQGFGPYNPRRNDPLHLTLVCGDPGQVGEVSHPQLEGVCGGSTAHYQAGTPYHIALAGRHVGIGDDMVGVLGVARRYLGQYGGSTGGRMNIAKKAKNNTNAAASTRPKRPEMIKMQPS